MIKIVKGGNIKIRYSKIIRKEFECIAQSWGNNKQFKFLQKDKPIFRLTAQNQLSIFMPTKMITIGTISVNFPTIQQQLPIIPLILSWIHLLSFYTSYYQIIIQYFIDMELGITKKKLLLVVGRTGVGKSSFVAQLVSQKGQQLSQQLNIKRQGGISSVTDQCTIYTVHPSHQLLQNENLYVMDTPGLDSEDSVSLIVQMIDRILIKQQQSQYEIIGIAYLILVHGGPRQNCYIERLMEVLKLKWETKMSLIFCVISQWDVAEHLRKIKKKEIEKVMNDWNNYLTDLQIGLIWEKKIKWSSSPADSQDKLSFGDYLQSSNGTTNINEQWSQLRSNLQLQYDFRQSFNTYKQDYKIFWESVSDITQKELSSSKNLYQMVKTSFEIKLKNDGSINNSKTKMTKVGLGLLASASFVTTLVTQSLGRIISAVIGSIFTIGTIVIDFPDINIKQMKGILKGKVETKLYQQIVKKLILEYIKNDVFSSAACNPDGIKFQQCRTLCGLKVFQKLSADQFKLVYAYKNDQNEEDIPEITIEPADKGQEKTFQFQFDFKVPTYKRIVQIMTVQSKKLYGKKQRNFFVAQSMSSFDD